MEVSEKAKEKLDKAGKEIKEAIDSLKREVSELGNKVRDKLKGTGEEMHSSAEDLTREVGKLSQKVRNLVPGKRNQSSIPVRTDNLRELGTDYWGQPFLDLRRATDRLFKDFFKSFGIPSTLKDPMALSTEYFGESWPLMDIRETDEDLLITAELPGVDKNDIDVSVTDDRVTIRGEKREQEERKGMGYYKLERSYGSFQRSLRLLCEVETDSVEASFKDGVLTVRLPKSAAARERIRKIPVRAG
ncbi:MAG TPA: Hsp20/alpha crystallin family protein [Desulfobacteraceae bacterium]|nr:Hsp20/alpha crystallin family protein [Desulfobacteraceae bacterium]